MIFIFPRRVEPDQNITKKKRYSYLGNKYIVSIEIRKKQL